MPLDALAPDQRAVVQLVLQRGRSYAQIAELLKISEDSVRARAHTGLSALVPDVELPADKVAQISDFLLGQQNGEPRQATRRLLRDGPAREWAEIVRAELGELGAVPDLPAQPAAAPAETAPEAPDQPAAERPAPRPRPRRAAPASPEPEPPARSSRLGGAILLGGGTLVVVVVVLALFVFRGDDDGDKASAKATPTATATASATPQAVAQVAMKGTSAARKATGVFALYLQDQQQLLFAVQIQKVPRTPKGAKYALWLSGPGKKAKWIGDTPAVGANGLLQVQGPRQGDTSFSNDVGSYRQVLVTREHGTQRKQPGATLVRGTLRQQG